MFMFEVIYVGWFRKKYSFKFSFMIRTYQKVI